MNYSTQTVNALEPDDSNLPHHSPPILNENPLKAQETAMMWQTIWPQLVAMAWANESFKAELIRDPLGTIKTVFNDRFEFPAYVDLEVADVPPGNEGQTLYGYAANYGVWKLPNAKLKLYLPPRPADHDAPLALINYQASGRIFPFSSF